MQTKADVRDKPSDTTQNNPYRLVSPYFADEIAELAPYAHDRQ